LATELPAKYLCAPLLGVAAYTGANVVVNAIKNRPLAENWNTTDATYSGVAGELIALFPDDAPIIAIPIAGAITGWAGDVIDQERKNPGKPINWNHAACASKAGFVGGVPIIGNPLKSLLWNIMQGTGTAFYCGE
jgi:hypothetical protein